MSPETYDQAWRRLDAEYAQRAREADAAKVEQILATHNWVGGFYCRCGAPIDIPNHWGQHLLELALFDDVEPRP